MSKSILIHKGLNGWSFELGNSEFFATELHSLITLLETMKENGELK